MKLAFALLLLAVSCLAQAAPFVVADVVAGIATCGVKVDGVAKADVAATALVCKHDVAGVAAGSHSVTMTAKTAADPVWGTQESAPSAPFSFVAPAPPSVPSTLRLTP